MGENIVIGPGQLYIGGYEGGPVEITEFRCDLDEVFYEHRNKFLTILNTDEVTLTTTVKFNKLAFYKITGLWNWVYLNCPNRRVRHLMKYGKTRRVQLKNYARALHIIGKVIDNVSR